VSKDVVTVEESEWDAVLDMTLNGVYLLSHEVIPHMIRQGEGGIVNKQVRMALTGGSEAKIPQRLGPAQYRKSR
jgi:NAD(P)-dependent dehydrogenase (short-subunit alcohol dehydrogenase family)